ncbi:uncharacterized protein [Drosophila tropicalis]|uniref:uncharacterized protein n=1 Tax=Drosophila tropicalis TaxID=46794 RepID=UPI0035ABA262
MKTDKNTRKGLSQSDYDNAMAILSSDFGLMLELSPQLEDVFATDSPEYKQSWLWLNKLSTMECNTLYDRRMRNAYMSYLSVCLNQKRLYGIFLELPPEEELIWVDFTDHTMNQPPSKSAASCCPEAGMVNREMPTTSGHDCNMSRYLGGASKDRQLDDPSDQELQCLDGLSKLNSCRRYSNASTPNASVQRSKSSPPKLAQSQRSSRKRLADAFMGSMDRPKDVKKDMTYLLKRIKAELCGEETHDRDEYLEYELQRYKEFYIRHKHDDPDFELNMGGDSLKQRLHLLLNMQNDLIQILSER